MSNYTYDVMKIREMTKKDLFKPAGNDENGNFYVFIAGIIVTMRCNLKCKLCGARAPLYERPEHPSLDELKKWLTGYFEIADYTLRLDLSGGEPLIRDDLGDIVSFLYNFREKFGALRINTNGTIVPSEKLINALNLYKKDGAHGAELMIDDYPVSDKSELITKTLDNAGIPYILRNYRSGDLHYGGWVDYGNFKEKKAEPPNCDSIGFNLFIRRGRLYSRCFAFLYEDFGVSDDYKDDSEYIELLDNSPVSDKRKLLIAHNSKKVYKSCYYCNGRGKDSRRFPPAEQFTPEELAETRRVYGGNI